MSQIKIVVVGGGAGGLELVTRLGDTLGRKCKAQITLIDKNKTHLWKPLLHEVATGVMDPGVDALSYISHSKNHHFQFQLGAVGGLNKAQKQILLDAVVDKHGHEVLPARRIDYDLLVLAIGSVSNDFGTPGIQENCIFLDKPDQAQHFHTLLLNRCLQVAAAPNPQKVRVAIVGGGATGVELSAELYNAVEGLHHYGLDSLTRDRLEVTLVEAGQRILPVLPERISKAVHRELEQLGVTIKTSTFVVKADSERLETKSGEVIEADLMVWAAGIKAPEFLNDLDGLESNRLNQLVVNARLQTTRDENIFVIGDCAACPQPSGGMVPPRAQSAHQMATHVYKNILRKLANKPQQDFIYRDHGSLISLSHFSAVGTLMGALTGGSLKVEGRLARWFYISLYRLHQVALHGWCRTALIILVGRINRFLRPKLKLH